MLSAGFSHIDITPRPGTRKIGAVVDVVGHRVLDPLFARVFVLENTTQQLAIVQLDVLSVSRKHVEEMRTRIEEACDFPGTRVMIAATHNHAGPATIRAGEPAADEGYVGHVTEAVVRAFDEALARRCQAQIAIGRGVNVDVAHNRRMVLRDGTVRTQASFDDEDALYVEGPVDPELTTLAAYDVEGRRLGCIVHYTCHPTHHLDDDWFSAGWPGVVSRTMLDHGFPVALFLNGALGNILSWDPLRGNAEPGMNATGRAIAADALRIIERSDLRSDVKIDVMAERIDLPFRDYTPQETQGSQRGGQRFVELSLYDRLLPQLLAEIEAEGTQQAEIQVVSLDEYRFVGVPCELFCEFGLRIKQQAHPLRAVIVGLANGMVGYVPTRTAFERGGYETTFSHGSKLGPEAGDLIAEKAAELITQLAAR